MFDPTPLNPYTPEAIRAQLHTVLLGRRIELHEQVGSTNDLARAAARSGEPEGLVVLSEEQLQGRGRHGRLWTAPAGCCVLSSVLLRPRFSPQQAFYLTVIASLAIHRACAWLISLEERERGNQRSRKTPIPRPPTPDPRSLLSIKWPNDVLIRGRKVAGILCESEFGGDGWDFAVVGFGINANLRSEQLGDLQATATSLSTELGKPVDRTALLARVLTELESLYLPLQNGQFGIVHEQWVAALETVGKRVTVTETGSIITGRALGVDQDGALIIRLDTGEEKRVLVGDVSGVLPTP